MRKGISWLSMYLLAAALLAGCGFQLQGRAQLPDPLSRAYVEAADRQSDFVQGLRKALITSGAEVLEDKGNASAVVQVLSDEVTTRVLSVSAANLPREYELTYTVEFAVRASDQEILSPQKIALSRYYSFDERALLAKEHEESILREGLARDLVGLVMRRLSSL
jgi:LPS-assembly lipoprotein